MTSEEIANRLASGSFEAEMFHPDAVIWQNIGGGRIITVGQLGALIAGALESGTLTFEDVRLITAQDHFAVTRINRLTLPGGGEIRVPVCLIAKLAGGRISRLDEYVTESRMAPLLQNMKGETT